jgi:biotin carboxyl carrier protein
MKLHAEIDERKLDVEINRDDGKLFADVDGREYELEVSEPEPGVFLIKHDGRIYEAYVTAPMIAGEQTHVRIGSGEFDIRLIDPKRLRGAGISAEHGDGPAEIKTAMPGKVVRILVEAGAEIEKGQGIVVVEAMKMQNELRAPKAGTIKEVRAGEGDTVAAGDVLAVIE